MHSNNACFDLQKKVKFLRQNKDFIFGVVRMEWILIEDIFYYDRIRRTCFREREIQGYRRRSGHCFRRTYSQGIKYLPTIYSDLMAGASHPRHPTNQIYRYIAFFWKFNHRKQPLWNCNVKFPQNWTIKTKLFKCAAIKFMYIFIYIYFAPHFKYLFSFFL